MKYFIAILVGACIAVMVKLNGTLGLHTDVYFGSFGTHLIGTLGSLLLIALNRGTYNREEKVSWIHYCGGILGALVIILNNVGFEHLGVSVTLALALLGQVVCSLMVDTFGLLGVEGVPFNLKKIPGLLLLLLGIGLMMRG